MTRDKQITAYLTRREAEAIRRLAERERRSVSSWLRALLQNIIQKQGA